MSRRKVIFSFFGCLAVLMFLVFSAFAFSWPWSETEIKDEYLEKLFTPDVPYESVKVVEDSKGRRFIVVKTKEQITVDQYDDMLLSRGVNVYGTYHYGVLSWQKTLTDYAITITRKVEGEPDTIEISVSMVKNPATGEPIVAASHRGKEFKFAIEKDFGKKWEKIKLIPDKEPKVPAPKVGRYPGAKLRYVKEWPKSQGGGEIWCMFLRIRSRTFRFFIIKE